ncbi:hypothetical protein SAMN05443667_108102 [Flavobacterium gillisiae]|uniref:Uncharacterized protein n=1 Tax=Flavobacterium gillisiae TaxID=150146 RepID=A0A1H4DTV2_9FLAO|nr:hypothetical protein SAMN05443667_108102 [Flavobacterium gillisiae]
MRLYFENINLTLPFNFSNYIKNSFTKKVSIVVKEPTIQTPLEC